MPSENIIHIAIELSVSSWLVAVRLPGAEKSRLHHITGGDTSPGATHHRGRHDGIAGANCGTACTRFSQAGPGCRGSVLL
jgi:hypothetical protein